MSLLMDALRKAEAQKQKLAETEQPAQSASPGSLALEPLEQSNSRDALPAKGQAEEKPAAPQGKPGRDRLPDLPAHLETLDEQFMAHTAKAAPNSARPAIPAAPPASAATPHSTHADMARENARKLFEVKQPGQKGNRNFAIAVGLATLAASAGIGGYFWWQLQPKGGLVATGPASMPGAQPVPAASSTPIAAIQPSPAGPPAASAVPPAPTFPQPASTAPAPAVTPAETGTPAAAPLETQPRQTAKPAQPPSPAAAQPESPIRVSRAVQKTDPLLEQGFEAFSRGELDRAAAAWRKALAADSRNADALHGLAAIAVQRQQPDEAAAFYLRALEANPKDALALSGLVSLRAPADAQQTESRLKTLLAEQPDSPYLNFALGNLYARGMRWAEAQQAFFRAHVAEPANPDYLFNLAVSLDQLRQPRLAVQYYNQALAAAAQQPAGFDAAQVAARLKILQSGPQ